MRKKLFLSSVSATMILALILTFGGISFSAQWKTASGGIEMKKAFIADNDKDGDGKVSRGEAVKAVATKIFDAYDKNKDGYVALEEAPDTKENVYKFIIGPPGERGPHAEGGTYGADFIAEFDLDKNGEVSHKEWEKVKRTTPYKDKIFPAYDMNRDYVISLGEAPLKERPLGKGNPSEIPLRLKKIMPELYMITGRGANVVVRRTPEGLFLIDNKLQYNIVWLEMNELIQNKVSTQPIRYAFITHHHANHGGNNQRVIDSGAELIGHKNIISILKNYKTIIAPVNPALPTITFTEKFTVKMGGVEAIAYYWGPGHTNADIAVYFPDRKVVVAGAMLYGNGEPAVDALDGHGTLFGMLERIDDLLSLNFVLAVPGRGDHALTRQEVIHYRDRLAELIRRGQEAIKQGVTQEEWVEKVQPYDLGLRLTGHFWTSPEHFAPIYQELLDSVKAK